MARKSKLREFVVTLDIEFRGATAIVEARDEEGARRAAEAMELREDFDTRCAELVNWRVTNIEPNE